MIWFIFFCAAVLGISIAAMVQTQKSAREIWLYVTVFLLGFAEWISILLERKFNPSHLIAKLIDWTGL